MPALTAETTDYQLDIDAGQRCHWIVGRDPSCELHLDDKGVSRFHATIFHVDGLFCIVDHSLNGSHVFRGEDEGFGSREVDVTSRRKDRGRGGSVCAAGVQHHGDPHRPEKGFRRGL